MSDVINQALEIANGYKAPEPTPKAKLVVDDVIDLPIKQQSIYSFMSGQQQQNPNKATYKLIIFSCVKPLNDACKKKLGQFGQLQEREEGNDGSYSEYGLRINPRLLNVDEVVAWLTSSFGPDEYPDPEEDAPVSMGPLYNLLSSIGGPFVGEKVDGGHLFTASFGPKPKPKPEPKPEPSPESEEA